MHNGEASLDVTSTPAAPNTNNVPESGPVRAGGFSFPGTAPGRPANYYMMISSVQAPPTPTRSGAPSTVQVSLADPTCAMASTRHIVITLHVALCKQ